MQNLVQMTLLMISSELVHPLNLLRWQFVVGMDNIPLGRCVSPSIYMLVYYV